MYRLRVAPLLLHRDATLLILAVILMGGRIQQEMTIALKGLTRPEEPAGADAISGML